MLRAARRAYGIDLPNPRMRMRSLGTRRSVKNRAIVLARSTLKANSLGMMTLRPRSLSTR